MFAPMRNCCHLYLGRQKVRSVEPLKQKRINCISVKIAGHARGAV